MKCPMCGVWTSVKRTDIVDDFVKRRRVCANMHTFSTEERVVPSKKRGRQPKEKTNDANPSNPL